MLLDAGCVVCAGAPGPICGRCRARLRPAEPPTVPGLDGFRVAFSFDDRSRPIIAAMKYRRQRRIAGWMGDAFVDLVPRLADAITWIPATPARRHTRGFDQGAEIARALGRCAGVPVVGLLARDRGDDRQTGRTRRQRQRGPHVRSVRPAPDFVVIVDDVVTTGSSMRVAARELRRAGAGRVVGVAMAATPFARADRLRSTTIASIIPTWT